MKNYNLINHLSKPMNLSTKSVGFHINDGKRTVVDVRGSLIHPLGSFRFSDFYVGKVIRFHDGEKQYPFLYVDSVKLVDKGNTVRLELKKLNL